MWLERVDQAPAKLQFFVIGLGGLPKHFKTADNNKQLLSTRERDVHLFCVKKADVIPRVVPDQIQNDYFGFLTLERCRGRRRSWSRLQAIGKTPLLEQ